MDLRRLRIGELVAGAGGALLVIALLVPWYSYDVATSFGAAPQLASRNGFSAMAVADLFLLSLALAAVGLVVVTALEKTVAVPIAYASLLCLASIVGLVFVLAHLGSGPPSSQPVPAETSVKSATAAGPYLAVLAVLACLTGSLLAMRDERLSKPSRPTDPTGRPIDAAPEVERLPVPPAEPRR
ncbi:MAG: hypothetical protein M3350_07885 [Actinomycetota bacterium]|nr:hypothetical protein [Actinomycetota bacterium]MDQ3720680.1 hypothetical protein [Actinomycetota bacterium]